MYESITYEELKGLPRDQKIEALKELKALYPTQKKIAEKLGVNPANIYNMIAKYVKADDEAKQRTKVKKARGLTRVTTSGESKNVGRDARKAAIGDVGKDTVRDTAKEAKSVTISDTGRAADVDARAPAEPEKKQIEYYKDVTGILEKGLQITVNKSLSGEDAQALFVGIGNIFVKNQGYRIEIRISEK